MKTDLASSVPEIQMVVIERLQIVMKDAFTKTIAAASQNLRLQGLRLSASIQQNDGDAARLAAHSMVSSAGAFGLLQLVNAARALEYAATDVSPKEWLDLHALIQDRLAAALGILSSLQEQHTL